MSGELIDTTEMYLKTVYELEEEGIPALRARIVERLGQSRPTVSETVARMERDGLLHIGPARQIQFTSEGFRRAEAVMRRHRLAERLLIEVINLDWAYVHDEACRWEHVVSDTVADKIEVILNMPSEDPFGNPIPRAQSRLDGQSGLDACSTQATHSPDAESLGEANSVEVPTAVNISGLNSLIDAAEDCTSQNYTVVRFSERVQSYSEDLNTFANAGFVPGAQIDITEILPDGVMVRVGEHELCVSMCIAEGVYVR